MKDLRNSQEPERITWESVKIWLRGISAMFAIFVMILGLSMVLRVFHAVWDAMGDPEGFRSVFQSWIETLQMTGTSVTVEGTAISVGPILAVAVLGGGALLVGHLGVVVLTTGGKILLASLGDREAIKKILQHAFGKAQKPIREDSGSAPPPPNDTTDDE